MNTTPEISGAGVALIEERRLTRPIQIAAGMGLGHEIGNYFDRLDEEQIPPTVVLRLYSTAISKIDQAARTDHREDFIGSLGRGLGSYVARVARDSKDENFGQDEVTHLLQNPQLRPKTRESLREDLIVSGALREISVSKLGMLTFADFEKSLVSPAAKENEISEEDEQISALSPELQAIVDAKTPQETAFAFMVHNESGSEELGRFLNETIAGKLMKETKISKITEYYAIRYKHQGEAERLEIELARDKAVLRCADIQIAAGNYSASYHMLIGNPLASTENSFLEEDDDLSSRYSRLLNVSMDHAFGS